MSFSARKSLLFAITHTICSISGPELCLGNVYSDEVERLRQGDARINFLIIPHEEYEQMGIKKFLAKSIKGALFINLIGTTMAKIGFRNSFEKKRIMLDIHKKQILWPNTNEHLRFRDPQKVETLGGYWILNNEAIDKQLLFLNFKNDCSEARLMMEITTNFPGVDDYKENTQRNELVITFK